MLNCTAMNDIIQKGFSVAHFREQGKAVIDLIADHLQQVNADKTIDCLRPDAQLSYWQQDFESPVCTPVELFQNVINRSVHLHSPRYMGHQVAVTLPVTILSSAVIACLNQGLPVYEMGMAGNAIEQVVIRHLANKFGFSNHASGIITSGGSLANLTALLTARARFDEAEISRLVILVSGEAHYSIERAARIMGLPSENVIKIPVNSQYQMRTELLTEARERIHDDGKKILCVVGCACSTALGAYDDLEAIGDWAASHSVWFHVDGAHGAAAVYSGRYKHLISGAHKADSLILDFHKLLMSPSLSTAVLYKDGNNAKRTFAQKAEYLFASQETDDWYNSGKRTVECTKPMSVLNVYTILRVYGKEIFEQNINRLYDLSRWFSEFLLTQTDFELALAPQSNIVCFRYTGGKNHSEMNRKIAEKLLHEGDYYIVSTVIHDDFWLRITIQNPLTTEEDLCKLVVRCRSIASLQTKTLPVVNDFP